MWESWRGKVHASMLSVVCVEAAEVGKQLAKVGGCGSGRKRQRTGQCLERKLRLEETGI